MSKISVERSVVLKPVIVLCGSMHHMKSMQAFRISFESQGFEAILPQEKDIDAITDTSAFPDVGSTKLAGNFIHKHIQRIKDADAIFVVNPTRQDITGYIGGNTFGKLFAALTLGVPVYYAYQPSRFLPYSSEIYGMEVTVGLTQLVEDFKLAKTAGVASTSLLELRAVRNAFRKAGIMVKVTGYPVYSGVSKQLVGWEDTTQGATNRMIQVSSILPDFRIAYESGLWNAEDNYTYGIGVVLLHTPSNGVRITQRSVGMRYSTTLVEMFDAGKYSDMGQMVQEEFGMMDPDPYSYMTQGKFTMQEFVSDCVYKSLAKLSV